jgi:hypothetical protein
MFKVVRFVRLSAIAMAPESLMLLLTDSLHNLQMLNRVRFFRPLAIAMAPCSPMLLLPESP